MVVQDDQSITKSTHILLIRCPKIYFVILPLVLRCFKQVSKLFQPFIIGFKQLPIHFSILPFVFSCSTSFSIVFHQFFKSISLLLTVTNFKRRSLFKNAILGLDPTSYSFWMIFCETFFLTVLVFSCFFYD